MTPNLSRRSKKIWTFLFVSAISLTQSFAATYTVTNTGDAGAGTLRQAIIDANSANVGGTIVFNIPGGGLQTIQVVSPYPRITVSNLTIDGYSQPGAVQGPIASRVLTIQITATSAYTSSDAIINIGTGTTTAVTNLVFRGLLMNSQSSSNRGYIGLAGGSPIAYQNITKIWVWGCNMGVLSDGVTASNPYSVMQFVPGVYPAAGQASTNKNWVFGTNRDGSNDANEGNQFGATTGAWAIIRCVGVDSITISGNYFNLTKNGNAILTNSIANGWGIILDNCVAAKIGTNAAGNSIYRNIMVNRRYAININYNQDGTLWSGAASRDGHHEIAGNFIGTDVTGLIPLGTHTYGILLGGSTGNTIDGTSAAQANVIAGVNSVAIYLQNQGSGSQASNNNIVAYNKIGVGSNGSTALSNAGIGISINGSNNTISRNIISNTAPGVSITQLNNYDVINNKITQNSIYNNTGAGIDLGYNGVSVNDGVIESVGTSPNFMVDYPVTTTGGLQGSELTLEGYVGSDSTGDAAFANLTLEFFIANNSPADQNGAISNTNSTSVAHGEGKTYLGSLTTDANGLFSGSLDVTGLGVVSNSTIITATATTAAGSTSEFGPNLLVVDNPLSVTFLKPLSAEASGCYNIVSWTSGVETNLDRYELQSSSDAKYYATIATIPAKGSGTQYSNKQPGSNAAVYYRLRIIDVNGRISYSSIASVINGCDAVHQVSVWPNPVSDMVYISGSKEELSVLKIFNAIGQQIICPQQISNAEPVSTAVVDTDLLPGGVYYIKTATGSSRMVKR